MDGGVFEHADAEEADGYGRAVNWSAAVRQTRGCASAQGAPPVLNDGVAHGITPSSSRVSADL